MHYSRTFYYQITARQKWMFRRRVARHILPERISVLTVLSGDYCYVAQDIFLS